MTIPACDICGRVEDSSQDHAIKLEIDADGLWICSICRKNLIAIPIGQEADELDERIKALVGKSAGAICRTMNLPFVYPYRSIMEAAARIAYDEDRYMSAWSFVTQWMDGTTVWQSADKRSRVIVGTGSRGKIEQIS